MTVTYKKPNRSLILEDRLKKKILVLDGAMGTSIQGMNLTAKDFGGDLYEGCNENLVRTRPDVIKQIHSQYLKAGCDIVETNTFGATPLVLDEYELGSYAHEINVLAAKLARECADQYSTDAHPRFVAGSIGPTTKALSVTGGIQFLDLVKQFKAQIHGLIEGGVDYLLFETCQDTRNIKAGLLACDEVFEELNLQLPIAVSVTIEPMGTMLAGQSIEALYVSLEHRDLLYVGLNCATGPEFMTDHIRSLSALSRFPIACVPNAGLPDEHGHYLENPKMVATVVERFIKNNWVNLVGGCCGTTPEHVHELSNLVATKNPRPLDVTQRSTLSGIEYLEITDELRPVIVGERTNVIGSRKFKKLICEEKFEEASEIAKLQIKNGAQIIDTCLANPDRDELSDMKHFLESAIKKIKAPIMIDSTDEAVVELALTYSQGKAIINSINLEDGEERFEKIIPLVKIFGAAVIVGTIDDDPKQGMAVTRARKLEVAKRSYELLTKKYGLSETDIYWDPLVFPCATGDQNYVGSAIETIEGIRLIKSQYPKTKTVLGISNVSFGLPEAGREVLNSVFLYHCVQAGLDLALVNSEKLMRYNTISEHERTLAENLLFNKAEANQDPIQLFADHFRVKKPVSTVSRDQIPLEKRLAQNILEGSREGLIDDLNLALKAMKPLEVINGPLMQGMDEVGKLFNENKLIVAEVLQSAEIMKLAVSHLEPFMEKTDSALRGKMVLATVKGDVHDIGKNLVDIIFSNNGFKVINLGIKIPPEQLIQAVREHRPDLIGLSGLLVKSAQQMVVTAEDLEKSGIQTKMLVGGAALSSTFVDRYISKAYKEGTVAYASDAMHGLELAKIMVDENQFTNFKQELEVKRSQSKPQYVQNASVKIKATNSRSNVIEELSTIPEVVDFEKRIFRSFSLDQIWNYINPLMLFGRHMGISGGVVRKLEAMAAGNLEAKKELQASHERALEIYEAVQKVKNEFKGSGILQPSAIFQFFKAASDGNKIYIYDSKAKSAEERPIETFEFQRQKKEDGLCLSDYVRGVTRIRSEKDFDTLPFFVTTVGKDVRKTAEELKEKGKYLKSHILLALAIESAEGYAELLHSQIRHIWGFPDPLDMTMMQRFQAKYRGKRYSFGYPACPSLEDQSKLFKLLNPEKIGVQLTDGFMMDPEASVSAVCFHHPQATYFSVGQSTDNGLEDNNRMT